MSFVNRKVYLPMIAQLGFDLSKPQGLNGVMAENKMEADALKLMYGLALQAFSGYTMQVVKPKPENFLDYLKEYNSPDTVRRKEAERFIDLTCTILPTLVKKLEVKMEPILIGALGVVRVTFVEDFETAKRRNRALEFIYKDPTAAEIFETYRGIFDGNAAMKDE